MKRSFLPISLLALLGLAGSGSSQSVTLRGKLENVPGTPNAFFIDCTSTQISSSTLNLNPFAGQQVLINGTWNGSASSPSVDVTSIATTPLSFEIGGNVATGGEARFKAFGSPGDAAVVVAALGSGFLPFGAAGVAFLAPTSLMVLGVGTVGGLGVYQVSIAVPNDPSLVGLLVLGQGAVYAPPTFLLVTNPDCKTIQT
jgi:hypothetical protein